MKLNIEFNNLLDIINLNFGVYYPLNEFVSKENFLSIVKKKRLINNKFFTAENRQKDILYRSLLGVSVNIILNIILIEKFGINGAALATISAQFSTSLVYTYLKKDSRVLFFMFLKCFDARRISQRRI